MSSYNKSGFLRNMCCLLVFIIVMMMMPLASKGQTYADSSSNSTTVTGLNSSSVVNRTNASTNAVLTDSARITVTSTALPITAWLHLMFKTKTIPASNYVFIKYKSTSALLGSAITDTAYNNGTIAGTPTSQIVYDTAGNQYLAATSTAAYNGMRFYLTSPVALGTNTADIFYMKANNAVSCSPFVATGNDAGGVLSVGASITNPTYAIDGNLSTYERVSTIVSAVTTMTQSFYLDTVITGTNAVTLALSDTSSLLTLSLLNNLSLQAYLGNTAIGTTTSLGSLLSADVLGLLQSGKTIFLTIPSTSSFNKVNFVYSTTASVLSSFRINEISITPAKPTFTLPKNDTIYVCNGSTATLTADNATSGNELRWYTSATATGTLIGTGDTLVTSFNITADTVFYVAMGKTGCTASSERVPLRVLVKPLPVKPTVADVSICSGNTATLPITSPVVTNSYKWYNVASGGTSIYTGTSYVTAALTSGITVYIQSDSANGCSSVRDTAVVTVKALPVKPTVADVSICSGNTATLPVTSPVVTNSYQWYNVASGGTSIYTGTSYVTAALTSGITVYIQSDSANGCSSVRDTAVVTVKALPVKPTVADVSICSGNTATLPITSPVVTNSYQWYNVASGGTSIYTGTSYVTAALTSGITVYIQSDSTNGCSSVRDTAVVTVKALPVKPTVADVSICSGNTATLPITSPVVTNSYKWYNVASGGTSIYTGTSYVTAALTSGITVYIQSDSANGCSSVRDTAVVTVKALPVKPTVADVSICSGNTATLPVTSPVVTNSYQWYNVASGGTSIYTGTSYVTAALTSGITVYIQSDSANGCSSVRDTAVVTVKVLPGITFSNPVNACELDLIKNVLYSDAVAANVSTKYGIAWNSAALAALFVNIADTTTLPASFFPVNIPANTVPTNYYGTLKITGTNGCFTSYPLQLSIEEKPDIIVRTTFQ